MTTNYLTLEDIWEKIRPHAIREDLFTIEDYYAAGKADELMEANLRDLWLFYRSELEILLEAGCADTSIVFDLGSSGDSDIELDKDRMIDEATSGPKS